jgi:hypothetical protein
MIRHRISVNDNLFTLDVALPVPLMSGSVIYVDLGYFVTIDEISMTTQEYEIGTGMVSIRQCLGTSDSLLHYELSTGVALN